MEQTYVQFLSKPHAMKLLPRLCLVMPVLLPGAALPCSQTGAGAGAAAYLMRVMEAGSNRIVRTTENTKTVRAMLVPLFSPGELQTRTAINRQSGDGWTYTNRPNG